MSVNWPMSQVGVTIEHMFVSSAESVDATLGAGDPRDPRTDKAAARAALRAQGRASLTLLAERTRPVAASNTRLLPVLAPLADLLPDRALRRGSTLAISGGQGEISLALALVAAASAAGSWCAIVGIDGLGAAAAEDLGIDLGRTAVIARPGVAWAEAVAHLLDGVDLVVLHPPFAPRPAMVRRLMARARDRHAVLVIVRGRSGWPEPPDVELTTTSVCWHGAGAGEGYLRARQITVVTGGRRSATRPRTHTLWLPTDQGALGRHDLDDAPHEEEQ